MKVIERQPDKVNFDEYEDRHAKTNDASRLITESTLVTRDGEPVIMYKTLDDWDMEELRWAVQTTEYREGTRSGGLKTRSRIFGYDPRNPIRNEFCSSTSMADDQPKQHAIIAKHAEMLVDIYKEYFPDTFHKHEEMTDDRVEDDYRLHGSPFTSGIINKNNALYYHHDSGNFKGVLSNMIAFKENMAGGHLVCPEYDLKFEISDQSLLIFDGQQILHGVTPFTPTGDPAYRYTIVYYSLQEMWKCDSIDRELQRAKEFKTRSADRQVKREEKKMKEQIAQEYAEADS